MMYMFIGGLSQDIDCDSISHHIRHNTPSQVIPTTVEEVSIRGDAKAFKIYVPKEKRDEIRNAKWPERTKVEPYKPHTGNRPTLGGNTRPEKATGPSNFRKGPSDGWRRQDDHQYDASYGRPRWSNQPWGDQGRDDRRWDILRHERSYEDPGYYHQDYERRGYEQQGYHHWDY